MYENAVMKPLILHVRLKNITVKEQSQQKLLKSYEGQKQNNIDEG